MGRIVLTSVAALLFGLTPIASFAGAIRPIPLAAANPSITFVQGWWEQEHQEQPARERYSRLPPQEVDRYNYLQNEVNQLTQQRNQIDQRIGRAQQEQHRMLGIADRQHH